MPSFMLVSLSARFFFTNLPSYSEIWISDFKIDLLDTQALEVWPLNPLKCLKYKIALALRSNAR